MGRRKKEEIKDELDEAGVYHRIWYESMKTSRGSIIS